MKSKQNITGSSTIHGVILDGEDVRRILAAVESMRGDYPLVAEEIRHAINGADLSCHRCEPDCMDVRVCDECGTEFYDGDGTTDEAGSRCEPCEAERYRQGAIEARCHVPQPTDAEAREVRVLKGMER